VAVTGDQDWRRLVASGASIAHCPAVFARSGVALDSFGRYRAAGINIGLGTDTWPADLLHNMQLGLYAARIMEGGDSQTSVADMYNAATLGGARARGRWGATTWAASRPARRPISSCSICRPRILGRSSIRSRT